MLPISRNENDIKGEGQMRSTWKRMSCLALAFVVGIMILGCGKKEAKDVQTDLSGLSVISKWIPLDSVPIPKNQNLLTGVGDLSQEAIGKRPVAVMVNNIEPALPQYGISQADVIFEMPVEGDATRLMALYADYTKMPDICAIRSCRYYYPALAKGFDAFYVHWGMDPSVTGYVASLNMNRYDGNANTGGLFARDTARRQAGYALEHTGYFKGTQFASVVQSSGVRTDLLDSKTGTAFNFCEMGTVTTPTGQACNVMDVKFGAARAKVTYDAEKGIYYKEINGKPHVDGRTGEQLSFSNVFVLETSISVRDEVGHKKLDWAGSSSAKGYYVSNGVVQEIRWSKANGNESSYLKFYDTNGKELEINRGKSYIGYTYKGRTSWE